MWAELPSNSSRGSRWRIFGTGQKGQLAKRAGQLCRAAGCLAALGPWQAGWYRPVPPAAGPRPARCSMEQVRALVPMDDPLAKLPFVHETLSTLRSELHGTPATLLGFIGCATFFSSFWGGGGGGAGGRRAGQEATPRSSSASTVAHAATVSCQLQAAAPRGSPLPARSTAIHSARLLPHRHHAAARRGPWPRTAWKARRSATAGAPRR